MRSRILRGRPERQDLRERLDHAFYVIEVVVFSLAGPGVVCPLPVEKACDAVFLFGKFCERQLFGTINGSDFIDADGGVLNSLVADQYIHQGRDEGRPHEGEIFRNRVEDGNGL